LGSAPSTSEAKAKSSPPKDSTLAQEGGSTQAEPSPSNKDDCSGSGVGLICVTANGDFESIRTWCDAVIGVSRSHLYGNRPYLATGLAP
jgi:hypothetical protein